MKKIIASMALVLGMQAAFAGEVVPANLVGQWFDSDAIPNVIIFNKEGTFRYISSFSSTSGSETVVCLSTIEGTITSIKKTDVGYDIDGAGKANPGSLIPFPGSTMQECQKRDGGFTRNLHFKTSQVTDTSVVINTTQYRKIFKNFNTNYCQK